MKDRIASLVVGMVVCGAIGLMAYMIVQAALSGSFG